MCKHGTYEHVLVYLPAELSYTGEARFDIKPVDKCIAPIVRALTNAGIYTITSCCGHGKTDGQIDLLDGRKLMIKSASSATQSSNESELEVFVSVGDTMIVPTKVSCPECGDSKNYRIIYTDDDKTDVKYYDCMMCHTHWDKDGNNLGKY